MKNKRIATLLSVLVVMAVAAIAWDLLQGAAPKQPKGSDFTAATLKGEQWSLADHRGKGPVLVNFFATWCGPCQMEIPELVKLQEKYPDLELVLLTRESPEEVKADPRIAALPVPILVKADDAFDSYGVDGIPHTYLFGPDGAVKADISGYSPEAVQEIEGHLQKMQSGGETRTAAGG